MSSTETGLTTEQVGKKYKGIGFDTHPAGRYFENPYSYKVVKMGITTIEQNEIGVLIRKWQC